MQTNSGFGREVGPPDNLVRFPSGEQAREARHGKAAGAGMPGEVDWGGGPSESSPRLPPAVRTDQGCCSVTQAFHASEARISSFLASIRDGRPIDNGSPWSVLDLLTLAGCAHAAIMTHPPTWIGRDDLEAIDGEKREAIEVTHQTEVIETIRFLSVIATEALDGRFGEHLGVTGEVKGVLAVDGSGRPRVQIVRS